MPRRPRKHTPDLYGKCAEITLQVQRQTPDLKRVRGHYDCPIWGKREHWWLINSTGEIIDPTKEQFPSKGIGEYIPWTEGNPEPTGKCLECGKYTFNMQHFCSKCCNDNFCNSLKGDNLR